MHPLRGTANLSRMSAAVSRIHLASSDTPSYVPTAGPRRAAALPHMLLDSALAFFLFSCSSGIPSVHLNSCLVMALLVEPPRSSSTISETRISWSDPELWSLWAMIQHSSMLPLDRVRSMMEWHCALVPLRVASSSCRLSSRVSQ